jgi:hypothetical protein
MPIAVARSDSEYSTNGFDRKTPALFTSVSTRPKLSIAASTIRLAVSGSAMSPATVSRSGEVPRSIVREFVTTQYPRSNR